jgi:murein DD-endopeptidase MepM/ murein hydrolase activator NlpD
MGTYSVQPGDTLARVASKFGLAVTTIYWANQSTLPNPQLLRPGQTLAIPPIDGLVVVVGKNDTLGSIATKYGVASQDIIDANNLFDPTLFAGETIIVPGAETPPLPAPKGGASGNGSSTAWTGRLVWPVPGHKQITQRFGCTGVPSEPPYGKCAHYHDAIDIGAPEGSEVVAAAAGTVIYAGWKLAGSDGYGGGLVVWISHGGKLYTTYNHLSSEIVKVGQIVKAGQRIGSVGMTGNATGPHLHFEVWVCYPWTGATIGCARNPLNYTR